MFRRTSLLIGALPLAVLALAACGGSASNALPTTPNGHPAAVGVANTGLGNVLVDRQGRTLYLFGRDMGNTSACMSSCATNWPPLHVGRNPAIGSGANAADVGTPSRPGGMSQLNYNGHPLYTLVNDKKPGATNGEGVKAFGGSGFAVAPSGSKVAPASNPQGGGGGGYGGY